MIIILILPFFNYTQAPFFTYYLTVFAYLKLITPVNLEIAILEFFLKSTTFPELFLKYSKVVYRSIFYIEELMDIYHDTYFSDISSLYLLWKFIPAQLEIHTVGDYRLAIEKFIRWQNTMDN